MYFPPLLFQWDGLVFQPAHKGWAGKCDEYLVVGQRYSLVEHHDRSIRSHNHYFAEIETVFQNLRETDSLRFPTRDHLRKWALIQAGFRNETVYPCSSKDEAIRLAIFVGALDDYTVVIVVNNVVSVLKAKSQRLNAMSKEEFQKSKVAVLDILYELIGVTEGPSG